MAAVITRGAHINAMNRSFGVINHASKNTEADTDILGYSRQDIIIRSDKIRVTEKALFILGNITMNI